MKIDERVWIILALMVLTAVYIGWLHMVIADLTKQNEKLVFAIVGDSYTDDVLHREWPPVDARTDRKLPLTVMERND